MSEMKERYQQDPSVVSRNIAGEVILVPIRQNLGDLESIFTLNDTAARAWSLMDGKHSVSEIQETIVNEYEVTPEQAGLDLLELIEQLQQIGAIQKV
jgi:CTP synthase (UTP-ammonia lyase)